LIAIAGCSHATHQAAPSAVRANPRRPAIKRTPQALISPPARGVASPTPAPSPAAQAAQPVPTPPKLANKVPRVRPNAAPQILAVAMSRSTVHSGDTISASVVTTSNVASVQARIGGYAVNLSKVGVGRFIITYTVGPIPWFVHGDYTIEVIARNTRGDMATRAVQLSVR
jgi:hypothetical protein